jgi:hypothetical protein
MNTFNMKNSGEQENFPDVGKVPNEKASLTRIQWHLAKIWDGLAESRWILGANQSPRAVLDIRWLPHLVRGSKAISIGITDFEGSLENPQKLGFRLVLSKDPELVAVSFRSNGQDFSGMPKFDGPIARIENGKDLLAAWLEMFALQGSKCPLSEAAEKHPRQPR